MERLRALLHGLEWAPFILATGKQVHLSVARVIEALIIAGVTGGIAIYGMTMVMQAKMDSFMDVYERDFQVTNVWRGHIQEEIDETQRYLYQHNHKGK